MARSVIPSEPSKLFPAPFVEANVSKSDILAEFYDTKDTMITTSRNSSFMEFAHMLNIIGFTKVKFIKGSTEKWEQMVTAIKRGLFQDAYQIFTTVSDTDEWTLEFPWTNVWGNNAKFDTLALTYGDHLIQQIRMILQGNSGEVIGADWLESQSATCRTQHRVKYRAGSQCVRFDTLQMDVWFPKLEQGLRLSGVGRRFYDLSDQPAGDDDFAKNSLNRFSFTTGNTHIRHRQYRPDMTLAQNMTWNLCLQLVSNRLFNINGWVRNKESFFDKIRSNIPLGMYIGQQVCIVEGQPMVLLNKDPSETYAIFKAKAAFAHQLRWTGILAPPSAAARQSGVEGNLGFMGKKTRTSRWRTPRGSLLYNRETTEKLGEALALDRGVLESHDVLNEFLAWYQDIKTTAQKMVRQKEGATPKWGRWGFKPLDFAGYPGNAKLYIKLTEG